ncbi:ATP-binding protein [Leifsonia poae]|uniref:Two-component system sensor kinase n=1 Tax=Leifsonia poae TaxID=110933 RepID=A0A9W6M0G7_9MICO|nr:ATP-binding protein [Leifsonia poae]GLJ76712.1 putative two-component system sensor kinase [Leifsonia poae]
MSQTASSRPPRAARPERLPLARPRVCVLSGVSVALADHLGWPVVAVRWLFVALSLAGGAGALLYLWLWALTPLRPPVPDAPVEGVQRQVPVSWLLAVLAVITGIGAIALVFSGSASFAVLGTIAVLIALAAGAVAWDQVVDAGDAARGPASSTALRISMGAFLLFMAAALATIPNRVESGWLWLCIIAVTFAGAAVLLAPWAFRLWRELIAERTARIKEEQRAEIAAHLHDSVLQTLALIQNRAGASSEVARIARAQERELRDWLYAGSEAPAGDLATDLRDFAAALEIDHPVQIDVVAVGDPVQHGTSELAAAAREAMLNAARHAGGEVSVYVESRAGAVDVFVRDRGSGFDVDALPDGRLGVRESIIGRMKRAGGQAAVTSRDTGTEIHLSIEFPSEQS